MENHSQPEELQQLTEMQNELISKQQVIENQIQKYKDDNVSFTQLTISDPKSYLKKILGADIKTARDFGTTSCAIKR
jgi:hypothetical protein